MSDQNEDNSRVDHDFHWIDSVSLPEQVVQHHSLETLQRRDAFRKAPVDRNARLRVAYELDIFVKLCSIAGRSLCRGFFTMPVKSS